MTAVDVVDEYRAVAPRRNVTRQLPGFSATNVAPRTLHVPVVDHDRRPSESVVTTFDTSILDPAGMALAIHDTVGAVT